MTTANPTFADAAPARHAALVGARSRALAVVVATLALCWAAALNGQPFFHPDTQAYVRGPDVAVMKLVGARFASPWATHVAVASRPSAPGAKAGGHSFDDNEVIAGRSIYYGALAYLGRLAGGFWLTVLVQAWAVAMLAQMMLRAFDAFSLRNYAAAAAVLCAATSAPFFTAFLMPDIWAGVAIGAFALLLGAPRRLSWADAGVLTAMLVFAAMAHNSHVLVIAGLTVFAAAAWLIRRGPGMGLAVGGGVLALAAAVAGAMLFSAMVKRSAGLPPITPPFLTARLIADGTATDYLKRHCAAPASFAVCRYVDRLPIDVDGFLWESDPRKGVFEVASKPERRAMASEQGRLALAVMAAYPVRQMAASLRNVALQAVQTDLSDFDYKPSLRATLQQELPQPHLDRLRRSRAFAEAWPIGVLWAEQGVAVLAALGVVGLLGWADAMGRVTLPPGAWLFMGAVLVGIAGNAVVCGALSDLYGRYQARVIWLLPLCAATLALAARPGRRVVGQRSHGQG